MDNIVPPFEPQPVYVVILAIVAGILGLWMAWRITHFNATVTPKLRAVSRRQQITWHQEIEKIYQEHHSDLRRFHLETAKFLRTIASARIGTDVSSWTVSDIRKAGLSDLTELLTACENPSFAPERLGDPDTLTRRIQEVLSRW